MLVTLHGQKIGIVLGGLDLAGAERQAIHLARHLRQVERADAQLWALGKAGEAAKLCDRYAIPWRLIPFRWGRSRPEMIAELLGFALRLRRQHPALLMPYTMAVNLPCSLVWRLTGARGCIWGQRDEGRARRPGQWERLAVRQASRFISNSRHGAAFLHDTLGVPQDRIHVVLNGVAPDPPEKTPGQWRAELGLPADAFVACMAANLTAFKDQPALLRAWRLLLDRLSGSRQQPVLLLAGRTDEPFTTSLKVLAYDLGICRNARILGPVRDLSGLFRAIDLCVFSSKYEGVPNGLLEGMAAGLAVVGTDIPGIREAVGPEGLEFLAPPDDAEALAAQVARFALDPELRLRVGAANRERIARVFGVERMCRETVALMLSTVNRSALAEHEVTPNASHPETAILHESE